MPFPMKIQPIDPSLPVNPALTIKPAPKSRFKRLFEKRLLRNTSSEKLDAEVGSICLDKMVINFIEENNGDNTKGKCGKSRCNCFHGNCDDSSDDEADLTVGDQPAISPADAADLIKGMVVCASVSERNLLADVASLVDKHRSCKKKDELRKIVADGLRSNGRDASVCKSRWDKSPSFPAGEYEYIDVVYDGPEHRILIDIDFRSEFEIARSTKSYRAVLQSLPSIFVGKSDRLNQIISLASEAALRSLKKKGLSSSPWRKPEYMKNKWLSGNYERIVDLSAKVDKDEEEKKSTAVIGWDLPEVKPKLVSNNNKPKVVTGLAFILREGLI